MKAKKSLMPSLKRETLVRLDQMTQVEGGVRLYQGPHAQIDASRPCIKSSAC
jgi:hypothetical protein